MPKTTVVCSQCGQPVSKRDVITLYEDPDMDENEYLCSSCQDAEDEKFFDDSIDPDDLPDPDLDFD